MENFCLTINYNIVNPVKVKGISSTCFNFRKFKTNTFCVISSSTIGCNLFKYKLVILNNALMVIMLN